MEDVKIVQTELPLAGYREFRAIAEKEKKTLKEAVVEAIEEWKAKRIKFDSSDPLFDLSMRIRRGGKATEVDKITYSKEAIR